MFDQKVVNEEILTKPEEKDIGGGSFCKQSKKVRVQFDMSKTAVDQLEKIKEKIHSPTRAHVVRKALALFDWILEATEKGYDIYLEKGNKRDRIIFPDLKT